MLGQQRRVGGSADWGRLRFTMDEGSAQGRPGRLRAALPRRTSPTAPRRSSTGARAAGPASATSRSIATPETGHALDDPLPPHRRGDRPARPGRDDHGRHDPARDDPRRHRGRRPPRRRALRRRSSGGWCASRSSSATCRSSPTTSSIAAFGTGAVKITPGPRPRRPRRPACATACRRSTSSPTTRRITGHGHALRRARPVRGARRAIVADLEARGDLVGSARRTRWSSGAASAATTSSSRASRRSGSSGPTPLADARARGDPRGPDADPARALREDLGALADQHPRLERVAPAVVGPPHPGLVLPGRPRDGVALEPTARTPARSAAGRPPSCTQDPDIFDTWFSSGLWPFSTLGWPDDTPDLATLLPDARSWRPATTSSSSGSPG